MEVDFVYEPELEFGGGGRHVDIRFGLMNYGPLDSGQPSAPAKIRVGIVGTPSAIEGVTRWIDRCKAEIPAKVTPRDHLFPRFPGFNQSGPFRSELILEDRNCRQISDRHLVVPAGQPLTDLRKAVDVFMSEVTYLAENPAVDVIVCAPPANLDRGAIDDEEPERKTLADHSRSRNRPTFHNLLKAKAMPLRMPLQFIFPATYGQEQKRRNRDRRLQDEATRAWNFHTAMYYKAGGRPWRLIRHPSEYSTCFVGVSFYNSADGSSMLTSMAQVFNERGHGIVIRGSPAPLSKDDRHPHLTRDHAAKLLAVALSEYHAEHHTMPARIVIHKTSAFDTAEREGFLSVSEDRGIHSVELVSVRHSSTRLFRTGSYPPLRGTLWLTREGPHFIYTRGSVEFFSTYPGLYVPRPLEYRIDYGETTPRATGKELLELTKMNWNSTQFDNSEPISVRAARQVGSILKYVSTDSPIEHRYSYYM